MKNITTLLFLFCCTISAYSQEKEFPTHRNGLIYSERTMGKLSHIVDSLNLKYKTCNFNTTFYSKSQALAHLIKVDSGSIKAAKKDLDDHISWEDFVAKYPKTKIERNVLMVKENVKSYAGIDEVSINEVVLNGDKGFSFITENLLFYDYDFSNGWLVDYTEKCEYWEESLTAVFFPEDFNSVPIPQKYAQMIGYSDCLIDTTTTKLKANLKDGYVPLPKNWTSLSYQQKAQLLNKLRSTRVKGGCSLDGLPRLHAVQIALLAADTYKWGVFLKAHLDVMNDNFERSTDASDAWAERKTYIKELEELNIHVPDLILGTSFRIENPARNHYFGNIGRLGQSISESKQRQDFEQAILSIVTDNQLDVYNRVMFYFLYRNYNYYLKEASLKKENIAKLAKARSTLPDYISTRLVEE
jgi:hypothetical protein